ADLPRPGARLFDMVFTPQGRLLAAMGGSRVEVWDVVRQQRVAELPGGFYGRMVPILSPDGRLLVTPEAFAGRVRLWDVATQRLRAAFTVPPGNRLALAFSGDSRHLVVGGGDFTLRMWNTTTLAEEALVRGH